MQANGMVREKGGMRKIHNIFKNGTRAKYRVY